MDKTIIDWSTMEVTRWSDYNPNLILLHHTTDSINRHVVREEMTFTVAPDIAAKLQRGHNTILIYSPEWPEGQPIEIDWNGIQCRVLPESLGIAAQWWDQMFGS